MDISLVNIDKTYEDSRQNRIIFQGMNARFSNGKRTVILGKSGVGKSSLLNLISGIDLPNTGDILIRGENLSQMKDTERTLFRRRHIGFVYQFFNLIPVLSVYENVTLVSKLDGKPESFYRERAFELLNTVGLLERKNDFPDRLSGGEQQRVAIVRALVNDPDILLADEPTGNLDDENGLAVLEMISGLARENGKTLVMVTHSLEAKAFADQIFKVENHNLVPENQAIMDRV